MRNFHSSADKDLFIILGCFQKPEEVVRPSDYLLPSCVGDGALQNVSTARNEVVARRAAPRALHQSSNSPALGSLQEETTTTTTTTPAYQYPHTGDKNGLRANVPCRQIGHELDSSKSQGSTQVWWKTCLPSHGKTRTSSPSSKSTIQIGHVSRPIDSGSGSSCAEEEVAMDGPARRRVGGTFSSSSCSFCGTSPTPAFVLLPMEVLDCTCASSVDTVDAASRWVSCISCPRSCPSSCASRSFPSVSAP
jgi:hypothetical protein